jgi:hypothetical protein
MQRIVELCGAPPRALLERASRRAVFFGAAGAAAAAPGGAGGAAWQAGPPGGRGLAAALRCEDGAFLGFMQARVPHPVPAPAGGSAVRASMPWHCAAAFAVSARRVRDCSPGSRLRLAACHS